MQHATEILLDGLRFTESPRWHDGKLWFVDMPVGALMSADPDTGCSDVIATLDDRASGIGFLPDGTPLVVSSMLARRIMRIQDGHLAVHADLSAAPAHRLNDMVVDSAGRAYVDLIASTETHEYGEDYIALVQPDGAWQLAARGVQRPNGLVISADGTMLIHASTRYRRLGAFAVAADGTLEHPRLWAATGDHTPDGICYDAEGAIWLGGLRTCTFVRIQPGGRVSQTIGVGSRWAVACMLGGHDRRTLFMATCEPKTGLEADERAYIEFARIDVPGAGWP